MRSFVTLSAACAGLIAAHTALADIVEIKDGSRLNGEIVKIHDGKLSLETSFAGTLEIAMGDVVSFSSEDAEQVRFDNGNVAVGPVRSAGNGQISIATSSGTVTGATADVTSAWAPGDRDPVQVAREADLEGQIRQWSYEAAVGLTGRYGNTEKSDYRAAAKATLEGPNDRLQFYLGWQYAESKQTVDGVSENVRTTDEIIGGVSYTNFFQEHLGWYVREELERDQFENIDFRSTTAAGLTYRVIKEKTHKLEFTGGLAIRYEGYTNAILKDDMGTADVSDDVYTSNESFPGLDFGMSHYWKFADWGEMNNIITFNPAFEDFGNYRLDHLTTLDFPLGTVDYWKLRVSLQNQYNSEVAPGAENMDTTYAVSLLLNWK